MNTIQKLFAGGGVALVAGALAQRNVFSIPVVASEAASDPRHKVACPRGHFTHHPAFLAPGSILQNGKCGKCE